MLPLLLTTSLLYPTEFPQDHVQTIIGCGTGCRIETEQRGFPEPVGDGWIRLKVRQWKWLNVCSLGSYRCWDEPATGSLGPPVQEVWLFAHCEKARFATSVTPERDDTGQRVWNTDGTPKHQTSAGNPFMQWAKICPGQSRDGMNYMKDLHRRFTDALRQMR